MKKVLILFFVVGLIGVGCSKNFLKEDLNNPNAPTTDQATPQAVLPAALTNMALIIDNVTGTAGPATYEPIGVWLGYWNYQAGYSFNSSVANYIMTSSSPQLWDNYYGVLTNLNFIISITSDHSNANYRDISNILEAVCFQNLVDLYNNIPYSQALQGQGNFYPSYDKGSDIYDSLTAKLDDAMADIGLNLSDPAVVLPGTDDVLFGGTMSNWILFANTVKLRLLVRESNVASKSSYIASEISKTASLGYLTTDAEVNPGYTAAKPNPIWAGFGVSPSGSLNAAASYVGSNGAAISFYQKTKDSRLGYFYSPKTVVATDPGYFTVTLPLDFTNYYGNVIGSQATNPDNSGASNIGSGLVQSPSQGAVLFAAADSYLEQAEATVRGWLPGGAAAAQTLYQTGITKSYEYLNVGGSTSAADTWAATYYNQPNMSYVTFPVAASSDSLIHTIIVQKWAALNGIDIAEPYADWRRTFNAAINNGYPMVPLSVSTSNTESHMPFVFLYPTEEQSNNNIAWTAAGGPNVDPFSTKVFWMP
jgi:Starch-binding associating with outer membrane